MTSWCCKLSGGAWVGSVDSIRYCPGRGIFARAHESNHDQHSVLAYTMGATRRRISCCETDPSIWLAIRIPVGQFGPHLDRRTSAFTLPNPCDFLYHRLEPGRIRRVLKRLPHFPTIDDQTDLIVNEDGHWVPPVKHLPTEGRAAITLLLWVSFTETRLLGHYFLTSWLPTILAASVSVPFGFAVISGAPAGRRAEWGDRCCVGYPIKGQPSDSIFILSRRPIHHFASRARGSLFCFFRFLSAFFWWGSCSGSMR